VSPATHGAHPSPEEVDALLDRSPDTDVYDVDLEERVGVHVADCEECRRLLEGMRAVRGLLRAEGARVPELPADLDDRLAAAVARASAEREGTIVPIASAREGRQRTGDRVPRWLTAAAGLAVLAGAAVASSQLFDGEGSDSVTSTEAGAGQAESADDALAGLTRASGTDYRPDELATQVDALLAGTAAAELDATAGGDGTAETRSGAAPTDAPLADSELRASPLADPAGLAACLAELDAAGQVPLAVDVATWEGQPAAVIVLPDPSGGDTLQVWVVGPRCGVDGDQLLHFQAVRR
jgi:hypothetical protein